MHDHALLIEQGTDDRARLCQMCVGVQMRAKHSALLARGLTKVRPLYEQQAICCELLSVAGAKMHCSSGICTLPLRPCKAPASSHATLHKPPDPNARRRSCMSQAVHSAITRLCTAAAGAAAGPKARTAQLTGDWLDSIPRPLAEQAAMQVAEALEQWLPGGLELVHSSGRWASTEAFLARLVAEVSLLWVCCGLLASMPRAVAPRVSCCNCPVNESPVIVSHRRQCTDGQHVHHGKLPRLQHDD